MPGHHTVTLIQLTDGPPTNSIIVSCFDVSPPLSYPRTSLDGYLSVNLRGYHDYRNNQDEHVLTQVQGHPDVILGRRALGSFSIETASLEYSYPSNMKRTLSAASSGASTIIMRRRRWERDSSLPPCVIYSLARSRLAVPWPAL